MVISRSSDYGRTKTGKINLFSKLSFRKATPDKKKEIEQKEDRRDSHAGRAELIRRYGVLERSESINSMRKAQALQIKEFLRYEIMDVDKKPK